MRREHIERLLPATYQRAVTPGGPLAAVLAVMEAMHAPSEALLAHVEDLATAYRTPERLLPFLVHWVAWDHLWADLAAQQRSLPVPAGRLRDLVAGAATLAARRGTAAGLTGLLTTLCGVSGFAIDEPADRPFHLVVRVPPAAAAQLDLIRRVVAAEKPATTTCEVVVSDPTEPPTNSPKE
jgi:phage tail-like protein